MSRSKYLAKNTAIFAVGSLSTKIITFLLVPFYSFMLTPSEYGTIDLFYVFITIVSPILMMNIGEGVLRFLLDNVTDSQHSTILSTAIIWVIFGIIFSICLFPLLTLFSFTKEYSIEIILYLLLFTINTILLCYLRGEELLQHYVIVNIIGTLLIAILNIVFLAIFHLGIKGYLTSYIISYGIMNLIILIISFSYIDNFKFIWNYTLFKSMTLYSLALVPNAILWWVINSSDKVMIRIFMGLSANGIYAIAYKLPSILTVFSTIFFQAWGYSAVKELNSKDSLDYSNYIYTRLFSFLTIGAGSLFVIIRPLVKIIIQENFYDSWEYSLYLILGFVFLSLATFVATPYFTLKNSKGSMLSSLFGAVINALLNLALIPLIGLTGAALATALSYLSVLVYRSVDTRKYLKLNVINVNKIISITILIVMLLCNYINDNIRYVLLIVLYIVLLFVNYDFIKELYNKILNIMIRKGNVYE